MNGAGFLLIIVAFVFLYFVLVRPQKRRQLEQARLLDNLQVGDEVVTSGGIYGTIRGLDDGTVDLEVASGVVLRVARGAIAQRIEPEAHPADDDANELGDGET
jgi:preprotein translocase subunit YajC